MKTMTNPPGPNFFALALLYLKTKGDPIQMLTQLSKRYGDIVRFRFRSKPDYLFTHPRHIEKILSASEAIMARSTPPTMKRLLGNGLLTSQGQFHKSQRRALQPAFHRQQVDKMAAVMSQCAESYLPKFKDGQTYDIEQEMKHLTMEIVLRTLFGSDLGAEKQELSEAVDIVQETKNKNDVPLLDQLLDTLPLPRNRKLQRALDRLDQTLYRLIDHQRHAPVARPNILSLLLELQQTENGQHIFTDRQIRDEAMTMFVAGHETMSNALTWTWYCLSQNPQAERTLHEECSRVLNGRTPSMQDLNRLPYTRMVFQEAMRLYPPVWIIGRRPVEDFTIENFTLPRGSFIHISQYVVLHDARFHTNPERFEPERWEHPSPKGKRDCSYFPFGGGTRLCIGEEFAWAEGMIVIATLAQHCRFELIPGHPVKTDLCITLRPKHGMRMTVIRRHGNEPQTSCQDDSTVASR